MFPSLIGLRGATIVLTLILPLAAARVDAACRNVVAYGLDAEYMVLDPRTLATLQVGDLHWLGIHSGSIRAGSSLERTLLASSKFMPVNSAPPENPVDGRFSPPPPYFLLYLENLGRDLRTREEIPTMALHPRDELYGIQWADRIQRNTLIREVYDHDQHYIAGHELLDTGFNVLRRWRTEVGFNLQYPICTVDDRIYFAGRNGLHVFDDRGGTIFEWERLNENNFRIGTYHTRNCKVLVSRNTPENNLVTEHKVVDVSNGAEGAEFVTSRGHKKILYDNAGRLLQQTYSGFYRTDSTGQRIAIAATPTGQFSLFDATTGEVLLERELEIGSGELSREMLCDEETPRALVEDDDAFYLIDPNTLEIVASKTVPTLWRHYHVFE